MHFPGFRPILLAGLPLLVTATNSIGCTSKTGIPSAALHRRGEPWQTTKMVGSTVKVYWNIMYENNTLEGGFISDEQIAEQMKILNEDYAPVGIDFVLGADPIRSHNPTWFNFVPSDRKMTEAFKGSTKIMDRAALKIWTASRDHLAFAYPPDPHFHLDPLYDGIIYPIHSFPNSTGSDAQGHLLTHEVGHWSGLNHTFNVRTGCTKDPDSIMDTPKQQKPTNTCDREVFSCGNSVPDLAHNYMNYVPDRCRTEFTPGQIEFMHKILKGYRGITPRTQKGTPDSKNDAVCKADAAWGGVVTQLDQLIVELEDLQTQLADVKVKVKALRNQMPTA